MGSQRHGVGEGQPLRDSWRPRDDDDSPPARPTHSRTPGSGLVQLPTRPCGRPKRAAAVARHRPPPPPVVGSARCGPSLASGCGLPWGTSPRPHYLRAGPPPCGQPSPPSRPRLRCQASRTGHVQVQLRVAPHSGLDPGDPHLFPTAAQPVVQTTTAEADEPRGVTPRTRSPSRTRSPGPAIPPSCTACRLPSAEWPVGIVAASGDSDAQEASRQPRQPGDRVRE
jgi:hypothetical protein